jgi:hypothetical protein
MARYPDLQAALQSLPTTANLDEFCQVLEQAGFVNARKVVQPVG